LENISEWQKLNKNQKLFLLKFLLINVKSLLKDLTNDKLKLDKESAMCLSVANNTNSKVLPMYLIMGIFK